MNRNMKHYNKKPHNKKNIKSKIIDNKGNWEFNFFQKKFDPDAEGNIKLAMKPDNGFNPRNVHTYINPTLSKEEQIKERKLKGEKLKTADQIILDNYIKNTNDAIKSDIDAIINFGLSAKPVTNEGRVRLLLKALEDQLEKENIDNIANIYLRLMEEDFKITPEIHKDYELAINHMNELIKGVDLIQLQFTKFYSQMPPLNTKGFKKFDEWQIKVINNIDQNISTIVNAPTSAGKSVLSGYVVTKGRSLFVVPTDALAWQMSAYLENILHSCVPIITGTYQTNPARNELIEILNKAPAIIGTADAIVDFLPFIKNDFKWVIFDEIHMIGKPEGKSMEIIAKLLTNTPVLALSATIGNTDDLVSWFSDISPQQKIEKVICNKRFFNLQRHYYDQDTDKLVTLHPLALIDESQIEDRSLLKKSLQPTPPDAWALAMDLTAHFNLESLEPHTYFDREKRIELDQAYQYFNKLIEFIVDKYPDNSKVIMKIINNYKQEDLPSSVTDLIKLTYKLKADKKTPAIIFQNNTLTCLRIARDFAKSLDEMEAKKYPRLFQERNRINKVAKRSDKKLKDDEKKPTDNKKAIKQMMGTVQLKKDKFGESSVPVMNIQKVESVSMQEPHLDFILNEDQIFSENTVEGWVNELKKYFPNTGDYYHFMIKLLWRGVGVYAKGLPDPYLRLVQLLACKKQLAIVFSDQSLVFGVSMPFRTVIVARDDKHIDDLDPMMFHQMIGRAGRRGLDKEGNVIFAGYSWTRIKELSISESPIVSGVNQPIYAIPHANRISELSKTSQNWDHTCTNYLDKTITNEDSLEFLEGIKSNFNGGWKLSFVDDNINHLHMNWKLRQSDTCVMSSFLLPYLRRGFESRDPKQEVNQIELAHFLCRFIGVQSTDDDKNQLDDPELLAIHPYNQILEQLEDLQLDIPSMIDNKLYVSIKTNSLVKCSSDNLTDELRQQIMDFGEKIKHIQHFCFHSKIVGLSRMLGKLLTRLWWIYHTSSPVTKEYNTYESESADSD